jgi:hypothetical protein
MTVKQGANSRTVCQWKELYLLEAKTPCQLTWCKAGVGLSELSSVIPHNTPEEYHVQNTIPNVLTKEQKKAALSLSLISLEQFAKQKNDVAKESAAKEVRAQEALEQAKQALERAKE